MILRKTAVCYQPKLSAQLSHPSLERFMKHIPTAALLAALKWSACMKRRIYTTGIHHETAELLITSSRFACNRSEKPRLEGVRQPGASRS